MRELARQEWVRRAAIAAAYYGSAKLGIALAFEHAAVSAIWLPTGVALAAVLVWGYRVWPGVFLGALVTSIDTVGGLLVGVAIATGATLETLVGAYLLRRAGFRNSLERMRDVVALVVLAAGLSTIIGATVGVLTLWVDGSIPGERIDSVWRVWWLAGMGGDLLAAPALLVLASRPRFEAGRARIAEAVGVAAVLVGAGLLLFQADTSFAYPVFPLLFWVALRFRQPGAVLASLIVCIFALYFTVRGGGPFVGGSPDTELARVQIFVVIAAATALLVAAVRSERRRAEEAERALAQAQELAHLGTWQWNVLADEVTGSAEFYRIYGLGREDFERGYADLLEHVHPADRETVDAIVRRAFEVRSPFSFQHRIVRPDGEVRTLQAHGEVFADAAGRPAVMRGSEQDITALKSAEERFRAVLETAPDAMVIVDELGEIKLVNSQTEKLFGHSRRTLLGKPVEMLIPEGLAEVHRGRRKPPPADRTPPLGRGPDLTARRRDGSEFPVEISLSPLESEAGKLVTAAIRDVSERRRFEEELQRTNLELEQANRSKDSFLASVSHELRTPLNAILGFTGTMLMELPGPLNADQRRQLGTVQSNGRHLLSIINDLLDLAKIESGKLELSREAVGCREIVEEVISGLAPLAEQKGLAFEVELPPERLEVRSDPRALGQILINLTNNAIKFTDEGEVRLSVRREQRNGKSVTRFVVSDTGPGIEPADQERLFAAFERVTSATTARAEGSGLGLHISRRLATLLDGEIGLESTPGKGSTFTLELRG